MQNPQTYNVTKGGDWYMSRGIKNNTTNDRIAIHWTKVAHREWAKALNNEGSIHYQNALRAYAKAKRARHASRYK